MFLMSCHDDEEVNFPVEPSMRDPSTTDRDDVPGMCTARQLQRIL
jgi:hypothetical protein